MKNFARLIVALGLVALSISSCTVNRSDSAGESQSLVVGHGVGLVSEPYVLWADFQGYFLEAGLEIQSVPGGSSSERLASLVGKSVDVVALPGTDIVQAMSNLEFDPVIIGGHYGVTEEQLDMVRQKPTYSGHLVLESTILLRGDLDPEAWRSIPDLKAGLRSPQAIASLGFLNFLEAESVDFESFEFVYLSDSDDLLSAFRRGDIDAAQLVGAQAHDALLEGAHLMTYPTAYWLEPGPYMFWVTSRATAEEKPEELTLFRETMRQVAYELNEGEGLQEYLAFLKSVYALSDEAIDRVTIPPLWVESVDQEDFEYFSRKLLRSGLSNRPVSLDDDNFLRN